MFRTAFNIWFNFYNACEAFDRAFAHEPFRSLLNPNGVNPTGGRSYRALMNKRDIQLNYLRVPIAQMAALKAYREQLGPCLCKGCCEDQG